MVAVRLFIPLLLGTNREGRQSEHVARFVFEKLRAHADIETEFFDVRVFVLPSDDYGEALKVKNTLWRDAMIRADGLIIVSPEYNHGYPGTLKAALDVLYNEYKHKAVGIVAVSDGPWGGVRMVEHLLPVLHDLGLVVTKPALYFPNADKAFGLDGAPLDATLRERVEKFLHELVWMARALHNGRAQL